MFSNNIRWDCFSVRQAGDEHPSAELRANTYNGLCLSGTAEMGIARRLKGRVFDECELPAYFMAQSRCFRPELASNQMDSGLYRVHEFNKIELFAVCTEHQSVAELQRIVRLQQSLFDTLQLRYRVLDMPTEELGAPAARKFDLEAWMPGRTTAAVQVQKNQINFFDLLTAQHLDDFDEATERAETDTAVAVSFKDLSKSDVEQIRTVHACLAELLRHFWHCFPARTPELEQKIIRMNETLNKFEQTQLVEGERQYGSIYFQHCRAQLSLVQRRVLGFQNAAKRPPPPQQK
uniref:serine--tRNA ligase n=1 Tax=Globodera pallida TaxID=36090 RepID=A0A183C016_GLOPA